MSRPAVSVILPCYNAEETLESALRSLQAQTFENWELMAVDDGSADQTARILSAFARRDARIRVLRTDHQGIAAALNAGLAEAQAPLIGRMDADDESLPFRLGRQVAYLEEHPEIGVVGCLVEDSPAFRSQQGYRRYMDWCNSILGPKEHRLNRFIDAPLIHPTVVARRAVFDLCGTYRSDPQWPEDFDLFLRWFEAGVNFAKVPEILYRWADNPRRLSRTCRRYSPEAFYRCKAHYLARGPLRDCKEVGVWGAGRVTRKRASYLEEEGISILYYVDIDPRKIGRYVQGKPVIGPEDLRNVPDVPLLSYVSCPGARDLIRKRLRGTKFREGCSFWCVA